MHDNSDTATGKSSPFAAALSLLRAGLSIIPIARNGSKAPASRLLPTGPDGKPTWAPFQSAIVAEEQASLWWDVPTPPGIATVCGAVSGNLELIDFDRDAELSFPLWKDLVAAERPGLVDRLNIVQTPRPGYHVRYRCPDVVIPGSGKLAWEMVADEETGKLKRTCIIETRGEGGYALAPRSPVDCHLSRRPYLHVAGPDLTELPAITPEERETLIRCAQALSMPEPEPEPDTEPAAKSPGPTGASQGLRPGDDYDRRGPAWSDILAPHGWRLLHQSGGASYWRRPGKKEPGHSATTGKCRGPHGEDLLYVFSSNGDPFQERKAYGKFRAYALLNHGGDQSAAAKELAQQGYGERPRPPAGEARAGPEDRVSLDENYSASLPDDRYSQAPPKQEEKPRAGWRYAPQTLPQVMQARRPEWLVKRVLVAGQPGVIGGPQKAYKTTTALDLGVSLASGSPFLGELQVYRPRRVLVISGESGDWTIGETIRRICEAKNIDLPAGLTVQFDLPKLANAADLAELRRGILADGVEVVILDPLYLALLDGADPNAASNVYAMGPLLLRVARTCLDVGATPLLAHHATRPASRTHDPLELTDLAFAGIAEFARQWLLLNRRESYVPGALHRLWLSAGGSCGQGGLWHLDVDEGALDEDFGGRKWDVKLTPSGSTAPARQAENAKRKQEKDRAAEEEEEKKFLAALDKLDGEGKGASLHSVRELANMGEDKVNRVAARLKHREPPVIEEVPGFQVKAGKGATKNARGIRRTRE